MDELTIPTHILTCDRCGRTVEIHDIVAAIPCDSDGWRATRTCRLHFDPTHGCATCWRVLDGHCDGILRMTR